MLPKNTTQGETDSSFDRISAFVDELRQIGVPKRLLGDVQVRTARFLASALSQTLSVSHEAGKTAIEMESSRRAPKETPGDKKGKTKIASTAFERLKPTRFGARGLRRGATRGTGMNLMTQTRRTVRGERMEEPRVQTL